MPDLDEVDFALGGEVADLHGVLRALRERGPVGAVRYFGEPAWIFTTFEAVDAAYRDDDLFPAAAAFKEMTEPVFGRNLQCMHGSEHKRNRMLVSPSFRARVIPPTVTPIIVEVANRLVERFAGLGEADLVEDFNRELPGAVITRAMVARAMSRRARPGPLVLLDLALPRDVEPGTAGLPGVAVVDLETLAASGVGGGRDADVAAVRGILAQEFEAYLSAGRAAAVAPTVVALREKAAQVVDAELARLEGRLGGLDPQVSREVARSMQRITDKLLHAPTVRVKELAGVPGGESYAAMLRVLFDLDPDAVRAVAQADAGLAGLEAETAGTDAAEGAP